MSYCEDAVLDLIDLSVKITDMVILKKPGISQESKKLYDAVLQQYKNGSDAEIESIDYDDYDVLSEDSVTGEIIGFGNMECKHNW